MRGGTEHRYLKFSLYMVKPDILKHHTTAFVYYEKRDLR